jgi:ATP-dependent DNA ligase
VEWGLVGKKLQRSSDAAKAKGIGKSFVSVFDAAQEMMTRQIRKKRESGYRELNEVEDVTNPLDILTKNFVPAKPMNDYVTEDIHKLILEEQKCLWLQRKRDGQRHLVLCTREGDIKIYSRRMEDLTLHFPQLCTRLAVLNIPHGTILDGEIIVSENGKDNFKAVSNITKSLSTRAAEEEQRHWNNLRFMVFDVLYYAGRPAWQAPYRLRYDLLKGLFTDNDNSRVYRAGILDQYVTPDTLTSWQDHVKRNGWEGLILWDADAATLIRLKGGSPKRINCIKWKPVITKDVIALGYFLGSGNFSSVVGGLNIAEIDPTKITGVYDLQLEPNGIYPLRQCGSVGTGFNDELRKEILTWKFPCVIEIEADKQEPTGKFRFPVFLKKHEDKTPEECIGDELPDE